MTATNEDYARLTASGTLVFTRILPGSIERVWAYITEPDLRKKWIAAGEMDLRESGSYEYIFDHEILSETKEEVPEKYKDETTPGMRMTGRILAVDAPNMLHMTWADGTDEASEVMFELKAEGDKTRLTLTHSKLFDREMLIGVAGGWHAHVAIMADNLEGVSPRPFWSNHMRLEDIYRDRLFEGGN